ncbi:MAG TPA: RecQ family ATP-dependent DNA helicase [Smithellaceae bacterium]|mgnify:CR=1 FL=1|nr:RecQ family ATP-dependent DNA helicase [Smithellaceae bacterium]HQP25486.1 RecQ family ATP-dependent DNA helicase [Smithellaceae bacterium]
MLEKHLQKYFGFTTFKQGQREVVERILRRQSAGAIFPTGAGKSLCYQLSAMLLPGMTLVVSPLLSLMKDQIDFLASHNIPAARLDSTLSSDDSMSILEQAKAGQLKILMIAVERFKNERFRHHLKQMKVLLMVVDEAHCISEWGHNFRPEYLKLPDYQKEFHIPQALLLTATATEQVRHDMCEKFNIDADHLTVTGFYRRNLFLQVTPTSETAKNRKLLNRLQENPHAPTIVYVTLQKTAEDVAQFLNANRINAAGYHAGMSDDERENIQNLFMAGKLDCVAATIAFGMGIDKRNLRRVIHYDLPKSIENYSQEIGRSGRDGLPSFCEVLANRNNINVLENFIYGDTPERTAIFKLLEKIQHHEKPLWEAKLFTLSNEVDIRLLPLKTLLVYLDMEGIIRLKYTYFEEYSFKYYEPSEQIIERFEGERKEFLQVLFSKCTPKTIWNYVDITAVLSDYKTQRSRIVAALEYFAEKKWIELRAHKSTETYDILTRSFDIDQMTDKIFNIFIDKEARQIRRIQDMIAFFESPNCLNINLASYFGEKLNFTACGHCSVCKQGESLIQQTADMPDLACVDLYDLSLDFLNTAKKDASDVNLTKFLCGIQTPLFRKLKVHKFKHFGMLQQYPFQDVKKRVIDENLLIHTGNENAINAERSPQNAVQSKQITQAKEKPPESKIIVRQRNYLLIGDQFNQGVSIDQLALDCNISRNEVIEHLGKYVSDHRLLNEAYLLKNSRLPEDELLSLLSTLHHSRTDRLNYNYKKIIGSIPYEELKLLSLYLSCGEQIRSDADKLKTFVVLAASRKYGGYCIAGKEWADGKIGPWIRPVSRRTNGELSEKDIRMSNKELPSLMDIIEVETQGLASHAYQKENYYAVEKQTWVWQWKLPNAALNRLLDSPSSLWLEGFSSTSGLNDRIPEEIVVENNTPSLYLIHPDDFTVLVTDDLHGRKKVNARFSYRGMPYLLSVTDMMIEREYLMRPQDEYPLENKNIYLTISLGEPFNGFCYKLVAAVMMQNRD